MHNTQIQIGFSNEFYHSFHTAIQNKNSCKIYKIKLIYVKQMFYLVFFFVLSFTEVSVIQTLTFMLWMEKKLTQQS